MLQTLQKADTDARAAIASVVGEILGEKVVADPDPPQPTVIDDDRLRHARLQPKAKETISTMLKAAKAGETVKEPIVDGDAMTIARAPSDRPLTTPALIVFGRGDPERLPRRSDCARGVW